MHRLLMGAVIAATLMSVEARRRRARPMRRSARFRGRWFWDRSARWPARWSGIPRGRRSQVPGDCTVPSRVTARRARGHRAWRRASSRWAARMLRRRPRPPSGRPAERPRRFRDLIEREASAPFEKEFDTSGKSPALGHHRKDRSPRRETGRGFFRSMRSATCGLNPVRPLWSPSCGQVTVVSPTCVLVG